jgi:BppU N-terminal domain
MTRCAADELCVGPFVAGEVPDPLVYQYQKADGSPLPLDGYSASFCWAERWGPGGQAGASVTDAPQGEVTYTWTGPEVEQPGQYSAQLWVEKAGSPRYASLRIRYQVAAAVCAA